MIDQILRRAWHYWRQQVVVPCIPREMQLNEVLFAEYFYFYAVALEWPDVYSCRRSSRVIFQRLH